MAALLDATDSQMAMLADLVESMQAAESTLASMQAARDGILALAGRLAIDIAKQGDHPDKGDMTIRAVAAEIGQALRVSDRTIERRMGDASWLVDAFPSVWAAQGAGRISAGHARVIIDAGAHLTDDADRERYAAAVLPLAEAESPNRLRPLAKRIAERLQERSIDERHQAARAERRVWSADANDAMADLHVHAPAVLVHGMMDRLSQMAHLIKNENARLAREAAAEGREFETDTRTVDEIRADLLVDLVLTGAPTGHDTSDRLLGELRAHIEITVPVMTLMGQDLHQGADAADTATSEESLDFTTNSGSNSGSPDDHTPPPLSTPLPPALLDGMIPIDADTAQATSQSAGSALPFPHLRNRRPQVRRGPHRSSVHRWRHLRHEPRRLLPSTSHAQAPLPLASDTTPRRTARVAKPHRADLHRPSTSAEHRRIRT